MLKGLVRFAGGRRSINFYFSTVTLADAALALGLGVGALLRLPLGRGGRDALARSVLERFGPRDVYLYGSARSALYHHLSSLRFERGSEAVVTGFTCDAVPNAVIQAGLTPVYADIDPESFGTSPESVRRAIGPKTKVLIVQHTFGIPADIETLATIAREGGLYLVEDCAVALGSRCKGRPLGTFGDAAIFSFELSKTITSCRGGMLFVNTDALGARALQRSAYESVPEQGAAQAAGILLQLGFSGILYRPVISNLGLFVSALLFKLGIFVKSTSDEELKARMPKSYMHRLSGCQALLLDRQLRRIEAIRAASRRATRCYGDALGTVGDFEVPASVRGEDACCIRFPVLTGRRDAVAEALARSGIEPGLWFSAPISSPEIDAALFGYGAGSCPVAERTAERMVNLPTSVRLRPSDLKRIVRLCRSVGSEPQA